MKRLIIGLYSAVGLFTIGISAAPKEPIVVTLWCLLACGVAVAITCWLLTLARRKGQRLWPVLVGGAACLAVIAWVAIFHWPLRAAYIVSRSSLNELAQDARAGRPFVGPARAGLFTIVDAEVSRAGVVCLWGDIDSSGRTGFVQCLPDRVPLNLWSMVSLDDRWQLIAED